MSMKTFTKRFIRNEKGAVMLEFVLSLPLIMLVFAIIVESGRLFWSYQAAVTGVRDAARYVARVTPVDICVAGSSSTIPVSEADLKARIGNTIGGTPLFPSTVTLVSAPPAHKCVPGVAPVSYRLDPAPVAIVTATVEFEFPFYGVMQLIGGGNYAPITSRISSESRIFGL